MLAGRNFNILTPIWSIVSDFYTHKNNSWNQSKEVYVLKNGSWTKVWNRNYPGPVGQQHPHWQYAVNYNFQKTDDTISWGTYWSTNNAGFYYYPSVGVLRLQIGAVDNNGFGDCYLEPAVTLRVLPGQTYTHSVYIERKTSLVNFSLRAYTNTTKEEAYKAGSGRTAFETTLQDVPAGTTVSNSITIPAGHEWIKLYLYIQTNNPLPRYYRFSQWKFTRTA